MNDIATPSLSIKASDDERKPLWPLQGLNFFMADMQAGIGPFLGVFLLAHGWKSGWIGSVMTIGGVAGMIMTIAQPSAAGSRRT